MIYTLPLGPLATNCYIVTDDNNTGVIIDPAANAVKIKEFLDEEKIDLKAILLTHSHYDHIGAVSKLLELYPDIKCYLNEREKIVYERYTKGEGLPAYLKPSDYKDFRYTDNADEGDIINVGELSFKILSTPGHTPGGLTYICDNTMFTGDTLFKGSMGRCDLIGGDEKAIMKSLKKLYEYEGDYIVCPGHEGASTLQKERETNPYMRMALK